MPAVCQSRNVLIRHFQNCKAAEDIFPSLLTDSTTHQAIGRFQAKIDTVKSDQAHVYASCGLFIASGTVKFTGQQDEFFQNCIHLGVLVENNLDCCAFDVN